MYTGTGKPPINGWIGQDLIINPTSLKKEHNPLFLKKIFLPQVRL